MLNEIFQKSELPPRSTKTTDSNCGVPSLPEINIDNEHLNGLIKTAIDEIPDKVNENCRNFPNQIVVADPDPFQVPDTNLKLTKDSTDKEITMAAIVAAFATQARDAIKVIYIY